jgi:shikimate kinase
MKTNITLIGMAGAGKSTVGIILAKNLGLGFLDTDVLIQINRQRTLQTILDEDGYLALRDIEEEEILKVNLSNHIIATGGSAVYSQKAMEHLRSISVIIFLETPFDEITRRIHNIDSRGLAKAPAQTFRELYDERDTLYRRYADIIINTDQLDQDQVAELAGSQYNR